MGLHFKITIMALGIFACMSSMLHIIGVSQTPICRAIPTIWRTSGKKMDTALVR